LAHADRDHRESRTVESFAHGSELIDDLLAVAPLLDHLDDPAELPTVHQPTLRVAPEAFFSTAGEAGQRHPFQQRLQVWDVARGQRRALRDFAPDLPGEPIFVPPRYVLSLVYRAADDRSDLYVLDADRLQTIARLPLPHHVPPGFHGTWVA
jgi:carotenoid cleavage dioxygenase-like enzyme